MPNVEYVREHAADHAQSMIAWFLGLSADTAGRLTDFNPGSNVRTLLESVGLQLEHLDLKVYAALTRAIPDILYEFFGPGDGVTTQVGFPALPALPATGVALFTMDNTLPVPIAIPAGTLLVPVNVATPATPLTYATLVDAVLATAPSVLVPIACTTPGPVGSCAAGTLVLQTQIAGIASATNVAALTGVAAETDEAHRLRFAQYIQNLARCQLAGLEVGACMTQLVQNGVVIERVLAARALDRPNARGYVDLWIDDGGATATPALVTACQTVIDGTLNSDGTRTPGYRAAGIVATVQAVTPVIVPVTASLVISPTLVFADVAAAVTAAVDTYIAGLHVFDSLIRSELIGVIATVPGVVDHTLVTPADNVVAPQGGRIVAGPITLTNATT